LPDGFSDSVIATGITGATALAVAPDGRVFVCEQTGALRVVKDDRLLPDPFVILEVDSYWERGLIGVTLDPDFVQNHYVYLNYIVPKPYPHHRISRFTARGDIAEPKSEFILLEGDDQTKLGGAEPGGHQGGGLHFGKDGKLYIAIGEQTAGSPAQRMDTFQGKLLRINSDGSIPEDNPFYQAAKGKYRAIWALGLRNPFAFSVQPGTGRILINDVGNARIEEINEGVAGANYGWPESEGPTTNPEHRGPLYAYDHNLGRSITGGTFYNPLHSQFPPRYVGKYFFVDFMDNWIRVLDPDHPDQVELFATGLLGPVDLATAPDGSLYYLNRNAWVKDDKFQPRTGSLHRIRCTADSTQPLPRITNQPGEVVAAEGLEATVRVAVEGGSPLSYRWLRDGKLLPDADSTFCKLPRVRAEDDGAQFRAVVSNPFGITKSKRIALRVLPLRAPALDVPRVAGLTVNCYEGRWPGLPDFTRLKPSKTGTVANIDLTPWTRDEAFGCSYEGFIRVDADGVYTFSLVASGISKLFVGGAEVTGTPGTTDREHTGSVALRAGHHQFRLLFVQGAGSPRLQLRSSGPQLEEQAIPDRAFSRVDPDSPPKRRPEESESSGVTAHGLSCRELVTTLNVPADSTELPPLLSQTGVFCSLADLTPNRGIIPYEVLSPLWSDGAAKRRWIALPGDSRIGFSQTGEWTFPAGTVFIKHFEKGIDPAAPDQRTRLETRLLVVGRGGGYGVTYKWRPDQSDADLLADGLTETVTRPTPDGPRSSRWTYPSRNDCLVCHNANAGFVLGVKTRQLNGPLTYPQTGRKDNQLGCWNYLGLFQPALKEEEIPHFARLSAISDAEAPLEQRVRSYLDSNCAQCHRPGGARGSFDARFDTPPAKQNLINGPVSAADLGVPDGKLVVPGDEKRSVLLERMGRRRDVYNMPPLATGEVDTEALAVVAEWIRNLR
jgi:uncharacterized repeat protein (TIGR03806 family)